MKAAIDRDALAPALSRLAKVADWKAIPILGCVLIEAGEGSLSLRATNTEQSVSLSLEAEVSDAGTIAVDASLLSAAVNGLPKGAAVNIEQQDNVLLVRSGRSSFRFDTLDPAGFPVWGDGKEMGSFQIEGGELARALGFTVQAAAKDDTRYMLHGVFLEHDAGTLTFTATDGGWLCTTTSEAALKGKMPHVIIPVKACGLLAALSGSIKVRLSETFIEATAEKSAVRSKLVEGPYPDWTRLVPDPETTVEVDRLAFLEAVRRVGAISMSGRDRYVCLRKGMGELMIAAARTGALAAFDSVDATIEGEFADTAFNTRYLPKAIEAVPGDTLTIRQDPPGPAVIRFDNNLIVISPYLVRWPAALETEEAA